MIYTTWIVDPDHVETGDINRNMVIDLADAIVTLQICSGITPATFFMKEADINGDEKIGIEEAIYILQKISELR